MEALLNFSAPLNLELLEQVVSSIQTGTPQQVRGISMDPTSRTLLIARRAGCADRVGVQDPFAVEGADRWGGCGRRAQLVPGGHDPRVTQRHDLH